MNKHKKEGIQTQNLEHTHAKGERERGRGESKRGDVNTHTDGWVARPAYPHL